MMESSRRAGDPMAAWGASGHERRRRRDSQTGSWLASLRPRCGCSRRLRRRVGRPATEQLSACTSPSVRDGPAHCEPGRGAGRGRRERAQPGDLGGRVRGGVDRARDRAPAERAPEPARPAEERARPIHGHVRRTMVTELHEGTYFAVIELELRGRSARASTRGPSDAIAVALRAGAPLFVRDSLFEPRIEIPDDERRRRNRLARRARARMPCARDALAR